ncbi:CL17A protein, partial [Piaya cayana]|nr:CL17A protein [Piaya cayana]
IYSVAGKMTPMRDFRPASPDSFEDDYDDVSLSESDLGHKAPAPDEELESEKGKGGPGRCHQPPPRGRIWPPPRDPESRGGGGRSRRATSVAVLYVLVALSFVAWALLFALAVMKQLEIMEELKLLRSNCSASQADVRQELAEARRKQTRLRTRLQSYYEELQDIAAQICPFIPRHKKCSAGWTMFERSCYFFSAETAGWPEAEEICADQGAHLVVIGSEPEQVRRPLP